MKQILLMIVVVALVAGCGTTKLDPNAPANISDPIVEKKVRLRAKKLTGELTNADLANVIQLNLTGAKITDAGLKDVAKLQKLEWLFLSNTQITDACLKDLAKLQNLTILRLNYTQITDAGAAELKKALPKLKTFNHRYKKD